MSGSTPETASQPLLVAEAIVAGYVRGLPIVHGVSLGVEPGEILVVLGPNGAGKSTLLKSLAGVVPIFGGTVHLAGTDITGTPAHRLSASGVGFVPQTANVFTTLTVDENLRIGGYLLSRKRLAARSFLAPPWGGGRRKAAALGAHGNELQQRLDAAYQRFPDLAQRRRHAGNALSGGQRQMLAIARALMTAPRLLLLDEPSAGLSPLMVSEVFAQVRKIADSGIAVLMVEQNVKAGLRIADRGLILVNGLAAHTGAAQALLGDPVIAQLYLGKHAAPAGAVKGTRAPQ